jgi:hypothetical protein
MVHKAFFSLAKTLGFDDERRRQLIWEYSNGKTTSLKEFGSMAEYKQLLAKMQEWAAPTAPDMDRWRKRCIAVVAKWIDLTGAAPADRMAYIREVACRTAGRPASEFNKMTEAQLRTCYSSFSRQLEADGRARQFTSIPPVGAN